jgi:subtilisin-like proprotein convertase family protein
MKLLSLIGILGCTLSLHAQLHFANPQPVIIPDVGPGSLYPSPITVAGADGVIRKLTVTLSNLSHTAQADVGVLLIGPRGGAVCLIGEPNGTVDFSDVTLTFDDDASGPFPALVTSGTYTSTGYDPRQWFNFVPPPSPVVFGIYDTRLSTFAGADANGTWSLYVWDGESEDSGILAGGWSLNLDLSYSLSVRLTGNRVAVSWPVQAEGYVLEYSTDLGAPGWAEVADSPTIAGSQKTVTQNVTATPRFYRLRRPQ